MKKNFLILLSVLITFKCLAAQTPSFQGLGSLSETYKSSGAFDVSADGSTVVGTVGTTHPYESAKAFRWTQSTGMVEIAPTYSYANGVSANGKVIAGSRYGYSMGFIWRDGYGVQDIPKLQSDTYYADGRKVSDNGQYVVGVTTLPGSGYGQAFRWTIGGQIINLTSGINSDAYDISSDGSVVVGWYNPSNEWRPYLWTQSQGIRDLGHMQVPGTKLATNAIGVSSDGNVVIGYTATFEGNRYAYRWTESTGKVDLGTLSPPGYRRDDTPMDVSADGSIIVGEGLGEAWIWDQSYGIRNLQTILANNYGLNLEGWQLTSADAVSNDGRTIVGVGINPSGLQEGWIAVIPEPATLSLLALGGMILKRKA